MLIECTYGPVTTEVAGTQYAFMPDEQGHCVAEVWVPRHIQALLAVVHYRAYGGVTPALTLGTLTPNSAAIGSEDVILICDGTGFTPNSVIYFNGGAEPTNLISSTQLSTIVKPSLASVAGAFPVYVEDGAVSTAPLDFTFTEAAPARTAKVAKPDKPDRPDRPEVLHEEPIPVSGIAGIGPGLARKLAAEGITDARQIAKLSKDEAAELDEKLGLSGRIARDEWIKQAKGLVR